MKINQETLQTGQPKGTYKRRDPHPTNSRYVYSSWNQARNNERWTTIERLNKEDKRKSNWNKQTKQKDKRRARYHNDPEYKKQVLKQAYQSKSKPENRKRAAKTEKKRRIRLGKKAIQAIQKRTMAKRPEYYQEQARIRAHKYGYRKSAATHKLTKKEKEAIKLIYHKRNAMNKNPWSTFTRWVVDHTIPLKCGGLHKANNLQIVPMSWNASKQDRNHDTWHWSQLKAA